MKPNISSDSTLATYIAMIAIVAEMEERAT